MDDQNKELKKKNEKTVDTGATTGIAIGFMLGLLLNVIFIPICIAGGLLIDRWIKNKKDR